MTTSLLVGVVGCCLYAPACCSTIATITTTASARGQTLQAEALRRLGADVSATVQANPSLAARAITVADQWAPVVAGLHRGSGSHGAITSEMVAAVETFQPELLAVADDDLGRRLRALAAAVDLRSLVGLTADEALQVVLRASSVLVAEDPPAPLTLSRRERGLARAGETVLVPAAARIGGAQGTRWRTDLVVVNPARTPAAFTIALLRRDADNSMPQTIDHELAPGEAVSFEDALDSLFAFSGAASLRLTVSRGAITVTSRTYNLLGAGNALGLPPGSTFGQFVPALSGNDAIPFGDAGHLIQLSHDPSLAQDARANLILVNGGPSPITVEVDLHDESGPMLGRVTRQLRAWEYIQLDRVFEEVTPQAVANGHAVVRTTTPGGRLFALASVVDNLTGDPIAIPPTLASYQTEETLAEAQTVPAAAHVRGAAGTNWRTDLVLHHLGGPFTVASVELLRRGQGNPQPEQRQLNVQQGQSLRFDDVLMSLFSTEGAGAIRVTAYGGPLAVSSRTYNLLEAGNPQGLPAGATFGQYLAPVGWLAAIRPGERALLGHLSHDPGLADGSRTNLVLVNNAAREADYEIELSAADGSSLGSFSTTLEQWEYSQIDRVFERVTDERVDGGYAVVRSTSPWGVFHAQASVIDNRTGDPVTVDAIALRAPRVGTVIESGNMLFDALSDGSLAMREALLALVDDDVGATLDGVAAAAPDHVARTQNGVVIDLGRSELTGGGTIVGGRVELALDGFSSGGGQASGRFTLTFDGFHVDGVAPVVGTIQGSLDLQRTTGDNVAGTIQLGAPGVALANITGEISIDTMSCAFYPYAGSISVVVNNQTYTITFPGDCDGTYRVDPAPIPYRYRMRVRSCDGSWQEPWDTIFLVEQEGVLVSDPSTPAPYGRPTWRAAGVVAHGAADLLYARTAGWSPDGVERVGWYRGLVNEPAPGIVYYSGVYAYHVREDDCLGYYNHSRRDPDFSAAILEPCGEPCTP